MSSYSGGCLCGRIRYTITGEPSFPHFCTCHMCQKWSGAPVVAWADFSVEALVWNGPGGEPATYRSSPDVQRGFCSTCGGTLYAADDGSPTICVTLATLDDPDSVVPGSQSFPESAPAWLVVGAKAALEAGSPAVESKSSSAPAVGPPRPGALPSDSLDVLTHNLAAWKNYVAWGNPWTKPVSEEQIARARAGDWSIVLTPTRPVPRDWFPLLSGCRVLCLASGGGQQGPVLAAAGGRVTVLDNSPDQLEQDRFVAERDRLEIRLEQGDMCDLGRFADESFDLVVHPVSNLFVPDVRPVWRETFRVLRRGGTMLAGFNNPIAYLFDYKKSLEGIFEVRHPLPYSDLTHLSREELSELVSRGEAVEFGHSLEDQLGGQMDAGFHLTGLYEDRDPKHPLGRFFCAYMATRSLRPVAP